MITDSLTPTPMAMRAARRSFLSHSASSANRTHNPPNATNTAMAASVGSMKHSTGRNEPGYNRFVGSSELQRFSRLLLMPIRNLLTLFLAAVVSLACYQRAAKNRYVGTLAEAMNLIDSHYVDP